MKQKKEFLHAIVCFMAGLTLISLVQSVTNFYNIYFTAVFAVLYGMVIARRSEKFWNKFWKEKEVKHF